MHTHLSYTIIMRRLAHISSIISLALAILISCVPHKKAFQEKTSPHHFAELQQARNLMVADRPQALAFLDSLQLCNATESWSEIEQQEFLLLRAEAHYKNSRLSKDSPELTSTTLFFDSLATLFPDDAELRFIQANAHYYLGTEHRHQQQDVSAASDFVSALKIMREGFSKTKDPLATRFTGLSYFRLGEILISYNIQSAAFEVFEAAKDLFSQVDDTLGVAASIRNIGEVYQSNKDYEKALAKFQEANRLWNFGNNLYDHALGGIFFNHQQMDSARAYLERSFLNSGPYARIDASAKLVEIYREEEDKEKEDYYTMFYVQNSIREANRSSDKMEIEFIADSLHETQPTNAEKRVNWGIILLVVVALLVIIVLASIIIHNRRRINSIEKHLSSIEQQNHGEPEPQLQAPKQHIDFDQALESFMKAPITKKIHKSVEKKDIMTKSVGLYPQLKLSELEFIEVVHTANKSFPNFSSQLLRDHDSLSSTDVRHCCLALMGLNDAEMAVLEGLTYSGANRRTNRILAVMKGNAGLEECVLQYLKSLYD